MENKDYQGVILVDNSLTAAFESIASGVNEWWVTNIEGSSQNPGDVFTLHFSGEVFLTFKVTEFVRDQKIEWTVIDCYLPWLQDKKEWNDTRVLFEFEKKGDQVQITMTHIGLRPEIECFDSCVKGWDQYFKGSLHKLLSEGVGQPN
jgi:hypothetical protein